MKLACGWLYALYKYGYPPSLADTKRALTQAAEWGFEAVEIEAIGEENLRLLYEHRREIKEHCAVLGVKIANFTPMLPDLVSQEDRRRERAFDLFRLGVEMADFLESFTVQTGSYAAPVRYIGPAPYDNPIRYGQRFQVEIDPYFRWEEVWKRLVDTIRRCTVITGEAGIRLCLEPRVGDLVSNTDAFLQLHEAVDSENFGIVFDTAHLHAQKEILSLSVEKLKERIFYVHAADNDGRTNEHLAPGRGTIDWESLFITLRKHGFAGYIAIDVGGRFNIDKQYQESKRFLEKLALSLSL
jgi:sugar phosphate isomerase/epimerase